MALSLRALKYIILAADLGGNYFFLKDSVRSYCRGEGLPKWLNSKNPPAAQETRVRSLGQEEPLEEGVKTYSSILGWRIPWTEEPGRLQSTGLHRVRHN